MTTPGSPEHPAADSTRVSARNLSKYFGRFIALDNISLTIEPGEFVILLGRNGAGKTTLLRILGLLQQYSEGDLCYGETPVRSLPIAFRGRIGFVGHETFLYDDLSARENLLFFARLYGVADPEQRISEVLADVALENRANTLARDLSRGLKQRLTLARAWLHRPDLLLLDEPATGLDAPTRERIHEWLAAYHRRGHTVILSSHELRESLRPATRIVLLDQGRVVFDGSNAPERVEEMQSLLTTVAG